MNRHLLFKGAAEVVQNVLVFWELEQGADHLLGADSV